MVLKESSFVICLDFRFRLKFRSTFLRARLTAGLPLGTTMVTIPVLYEEVVVVLALDVIDASLAALSLTNPSKSVEAIIRVRASLITFDWLLYTFFWIRRFIQSRMVLLAEKLRIGIN
ncbi:MAG: hypothetical protein Kow0069_11230 [Promethearchaeota archaeon]